MEISVVVREQYYDFNIGGNFTDFLLFPPKLTKTENISLAMT